MRLNIPASWDGVTLSQYIQLSRIDISESVQSLPEILDALGVDVGSVMSLRTSEASRVTKRLAFISELPQGKPVPTIGIHPLKEFNCLRLDEFIDLDSQITLGASENIHQILAILYSYDTEYDYLLRKKRAEQFLSVSFACAWPAIRDFLSYRLQVMRKYQGLFRLPDPENDPFYNEEEEANQQDEYSKQWGWFQIINRLAQDDITRHEKVLALGHIQCFNQLSFFVERGAREKK